VVIGKELVAEALNQNIVVETGNRDKWEAIPSAHADYKEER